MGGEQLGSGVSPRTLMRLAENPGWAENILACLTGEDLALPDDEILRRRLVIVLGHVVRATVEQKERVHAAVCQFLAFQELQQVVVRAEDDDFAAADFWPEGWPEE